MRCVETLGTGFLTHPDNAELRGRLASGALTASAYGRQLYQVVFRVLFLCMAEDRGVLHPPGVDRRALERYRQQYSMARWRAMAAEARGSGACADVDLWERLGVVFASLSAPMGHAGLGLPRHGSPLWASGSTPDLCVPGLDAECKGVRIRPAELLEAVRWLGCASSERGVEPVWFGEFEAGALGSIYELLLALTPRVDVSSGGFSLKAVGASERRARGSFYTPEPLVDHLLDAALDPVIEDRLESATSRGDVDARSGPEVMAEALLGIRVCDPAVGSGRFLVAAAHRLAERVSRLRAGQGSPTQEVYLDALRSVISHQVYGVDVDPIAVELCKICLWFEVGDACWPISKLSDRIRVGHALLGTTPELLSVGIPDAAFVPIEGELGRVVGDYKKRNRIEREVIEHGVEPRVREGRDLVPPATPRVMTAKQAGVCADAWCAAFVWRWRDCASSGETQSSSKAWEAITESVFRAIERDPDSVAPWILDEINRLASEHRFFHWHLAFPEVFGGLNPDADRDALAANAGFDVVIGNPPFLNQLELATATERGSAALIRVSSGGVVGGYADLSAAFLFFATRWCRPGGRVSFVQPQSLLSAKDARGVRRSVLKAGALTSMWVSAEHVFEDASVFTCAPTIHVGGPRRGPVERRSGPEFISHGAPSVDQDALCDEESWAPLVAVAWGVPEIEVENRRTVGALASATADFRDQYYGLQGFLTEHDDVPAGHDSIDRDWPAIVTAGLIDPAACAWGRASTRILKRRWRAPRIDRRRMEREGKLGPWIAQRLVPKVLLATQTRVLEAFVDAEGRLVPSVPLITITPKR
ncbi:MAG: hypothetical protein AAGK04_12925, partial [Planctomycetota bacterium]